jgi:hypothetical protein
MMTINPFDTPERSGDYRSYLVRLWRNHPPASWHATAQCVQTGKVIHFADVKSLCDFLQRQTRGAEDGEATEPRPP